MGRASVLAIVHVSNAFRFDGTGHTNSTLDLAVAQAERGHRVTLVCRETDAETRRFCAEHGVRMIDRIGASDVRDLVRSVPRMRRALAGADVVHLHTVRAVLLTALASPLRMALRSVVTLHNPHQRSTVVMYLARRVVAMSDAHRHVVTKQTRGLKRPLVIQNGTHRSARRVPAADVRGRDLAGRAIVFVGALHARKGIDVLLSAMPQILRGCGDARLYVIGNRDNAAVERLAADLGVSGHVSFEGYAADPREYMKGADVFVLPSRQEGFGNVLTEARESGVPIVASRVGGIPEALDGGRAGSLVPPEDPEVLAAAILRVLLEPEHADALRARGQQGLDRLSVHRAADEYDSAYRSVL
jgi:glycosyltransferase involved in cell wall biosynthesis